LGVYENTKKTKLLQLENRSSVSLRPFLETRKKRIGMRLRIKGGDRKSLGKTGGGWGWVGGGGGDIITGSLTDAQCPGKKRERAYHRKKESIFGENWTGKISVNCPLRGRGRGDLAYCLSFWKGDSARCPEKEE